MLRIDPDTPARMTISSTRRRAPVALGAAGLLIALLSAAHAQSNPAEPEGRIAINEENDSLFFTSDKHYTQGLTFSYLSPELQPASGWNDVFAALSDPIPFFATGGAQDRRCDWIVLGQSIFTPRDLRLSIPDRSDRPYAGWLYTGLDLLQDTDGTRLDSLEMLIGVVGSGALGRQVQNDWHQFIGISGARGWNAQLRNEPGLVLSYERRWRLSAPLGGAFAADIVPELGATAGNVFTYGSAGAILRIGRHLEADYGPARIRPAPSGTDYFNGRELQGEIGFYFFAGAEGRAVGRNIFLDGNTFQSSRHVPKKPLVGDLTGGAALFWSDIVRLDVGLITRTKEFYGQQGADSFAGLRVSFAAW